MLYWLEERNDKKSREVIEKMNIEYPREGIAVIRLPEQDPEKKAMDIVAKCIESNDGELGKRNIGTVVLDFGEVERISSTVKGEIDIAYGACRESGYGLALVNLNETCKREYKIYGSSLVPVYANLDAMEKEEELS